MIAIKVAPFDRYKTLDVAFGVVAAGAEERITLYTGNDDHIVADLVTPLVHPHGQARGDPALPGRPAGPLERVDESAVDLLAKIHASSAAAPCPTRSWRSTPW